MLVLYIFADKLDSEIGIPEGHYLINNSLEIGTVLASTGVNADNTVAPSLYSTLSGGYLDKMYFFVDGTVDVSKTEVGNLYLEVNAKNSYGVPVHIVYDGDGTGVENIVVEDVVGTEKQMIDGQLYVIRNGEAYHITGMRVK